MRVRADPAQLVPGVHCGRPIENGLHFEKDRWWDEDRHVCRRPGLAERFTTLLTAAVSVLRTLNPGAPGEPLKAQADALNWDIDRAVNLMTS